MSLIRWPSSDDGLVFTTSSGIEYAVLFREQQRTLFPELPELEGRIFTVSFFPLNTDGPANRSDQRIIPTIAQAIKEKFEESENVVLFIIDDSDGRQDAQWRMFMHLHRTSGHHDIELLSGTIPVAQHDVMAGMMIHRANPYRTVLAGLFFALLARLAKD